MKTVPIKQEDDRKRKSEMIKSFAETIEKHCVDSYEVESVINSMTAVSELMSEQNQDRHDIVYDYRELEDLVEKHADKRLLSIMRGLSNNSIRAMILAGQCTRGIQLIYQMEDDINNNVIG